MRVVSLLPSATETLCLLLGSAAQREGVALVGRSHECDYTRAVLDLPALTGQVTDFRAQGAGGVDRAVSEALAAGRSLYTLDEALLAALRPDLILTQDLCEVCSIDLASVRRAAARLSPAPEVLALNPESLEDVLEDVTRVAGAIGMSREGDAAVADLRERLDAAGGYVNPYDDGQNLLFLEWTDPPFVGGHWTPQLIERAGGRHPLNPTGARAAAASAARGGDGAGAGEGGPLAAAAGKSRRIAPEEIVASQPERIIVCPCGLSLEQARAETSALMERAWFRALPAVEAQRVAIVDGSQMFNRPGPRLVDAFEWLVGWLQERPAVIPKGFPWEEAL